VRGHSALAAAIDVQATALVVPATGSRWTITSREHTASRGRHPTLVLYDEVGWARDEELFSSLLAGQASVEDPLCLVVSTVGRRQSGPLWQVKQLAEGGDEAVCWWWSGDNLGRGCRRGSSSASGVLVAAQYARGGNRWVDAADSFVSVEHVDAARRRAG
jgi:hypothetical protein